MARAARQALLTSLLSAALMGGAIGSARAQVFIEGSTSFDAGFFTYSFSVFNNTPVDLATFSLNVPVNSDLVNLSAPVGFLAFYEPNPGLDGTIPGRVDFLADTQTIPSLGTVGGFSFQSPSLFTPSGFEALDLNGVQFTPPGATNFPGTTALIAAPEPSTLGFLALGGALPFGMAALRRSNVRSAVVIRLRRRRRACRF